MNDLTVKKSHIASFFIIIFIILFIFSLFGIDMTDEGKQMSISWNIFHGSGNHTYNMHKFGSWFINGLWLSVIGKPFLLWARLGGVILMTLMTLVSYLIMRNYHDTKYTIFVIAAALMFVICENHPETKIDHSNLPTFIALISILFFLLYIKSDDTNFVNPVLIILSAVFMIISVFTRVPHIFLLLFPAVYFIFAVKIYSLNKIKALKACLLYYGFILFLLSSGFLILLIFKKTDISFFKSLFNDILNPFVSLKELFKNDIKVIFNPDKLRKISYFYFLLYRYVYDFIHIAVLTFLFLTGMLLLNLIYNKLYDRLFINKKIDIILMIFAGISLFIFLNLKGWMWYKAALGFFSAFLIVLKLKKIRLADEFFYVFWGILLFFISFLGSNNAFRHSIPSGAVFIIFAAVALINHKRKSELISNKMMFINKFVYVFFIVILVFSFYKKLFNDNKRDINPLIARNAMFKSGQLSGIFSGRSRVDAIDSLISAVNDNVKKEDTVLCFNSIPMMYYLLDKDYFLNDPWLIPNKLSDTKNGLESKAVNGEYPDFIIFSKKTAIENNWPESDIVIADKDKALYDYINHYILINKFIGIYENNAFILYRRAE